MGYFFVLKAIFSTSLTLILSTNIYIKVKEAGLTLLNIFIIKTMDLDFYNALYPTFRYRATGRLTLLYTIVILLLH